MPPEISYSNHTKNYAQSTKFPPKVKTAIHDRRRNQQETLKEFLMGPKEQVERDSCMWPIYHPNKRGLTTRLLPAIKMYMRKRTEHKFPFDTNKFQILSFL